MDGREVARGHWLKQNQRVYFFSDKEQEVLESNVHSSFEEASYMKDGEYLE